MALIDKASLLMVPSTYEAGTLYNVLPSGNRAPDSTDQNSGYDQTRADFSFDRGSNAAATRIGSDGLIKKYRENLLLQSNNFGTTWTTSNASVTSGQADKDGSSTAWKLEADAASGSLRQAISSSGVVAYSVYAKAGTADYIRLRFDASNQVNIWFDLGDGSVGTNTNGIGGFIEAVGGGWYRVTAVANTSSLTQVRIYPTPSDAVGGQDGDNIYIQNAQLESSMVATDYLDSGATTAKAGVLIDLPRINYDANGENGALLLEPQRANLVPYSEYFGGWSVNSNITRTSNYIVSPDGTKNATRLQFTANGFCSNKTQSLASYTISCYAKRNDSGTQNVGFFTNGSNAVNSAWAVTSEWKRFSYTFPALNAGAMGIAGVSGADISVYGFQIEGLATYPSSYIPNHGTSSGVTRAADDTSVSDLQNLNVFNGSQGAVLFEGVKNGETIFSNFVVTANSNTNKSLLVDNSSGTIRLRVWNASSGQDATIATSSVDDGTFKYLIKWNAGSLAVYFNGSSVGTDTITAYSYTNVNLKEGTFSNNYIKQFTLFDEVPTDAECVTLTTL